MASAVVQQANKHAKNDQAADVFKGGVRSVEGPGQPQIALKGTAQLVAEMALRQEWPVANPVE